MKKEWPTLFPEIENFNLTFNEKYQPQLNDFAPGSIYRIGQPSKDNYQYIKPLIVPSKLTAKESDDFKAIHGLIIRVTSILRMVNGKRVAVLRHYQDQLFLGEFEKIFAQVDMSIASREIIALDLESKRTLESVSHSKSKFEQK